MELSSLIIMNAFLLLREGDLSERVWTRPGGGAFCCVTTALDRSPEHTWLLGKGRHNESHLPNGR